MRQPTSSVRFSRPSALPGIELVSVVYPRRDFPPHSHPEFVIGAVVGGAETLQVDRNVHLAPAGTTLLLHPDETHANASIGPDALRYRVMYVASETMAAWLPGPLAFTAPVSRVPSLFDAVATAHATLGRPADRLTQELCTTLTDRGCPLAGGFQERLQFERLLVEVSASFVNLPIREID